MLLYSIRRGGLFSPYLNDLKSVIHPTPQQLIGLIYIKGVLGKIFYKSGTEKHYDDPPTPFSSQEHHILVLDR